MRRTWRLIGAGLASEAIYLALAILLPWWRYGGSLSSWRSILGEGWLPLVACLGGIGVLFGAYAAGWAAVRGAGDDRGLRRVALVLAAVFAVTLIWVLPITSDLFTYLSQAHLRTDLGLNPFVTAALGPAAPAGADRLVWAYPAQYSFRPSVYGPAWLLLSLPATAGRYDVAWGVFYLKALAALSYLGCAWLVSHMVATGRGTGSPSDHATGPAPLEAVYLFAWNPLVLLLGIGDGHNDLAMMAIVLLSIYLLRNERWLFALAALTFAGWIKYVAAILLPLFLFYAWQHAAHRDPPLRSARIQTRRLGRALGGSTAVVVGVSALVLAPFGAPGWLVELGGRLLRPANASQADAGVMSWMTVAGMVVLGIAYLAILARLYRRHARRLEAARRDCVAPRLFQDVVNAGLMAMLLAFFLGAARAQPWHLIWPISLAGLATFQRIGRKDWRWPWPLLAGLSAVLLAGQIWVEWGLLGI